MITLNKMSQLHPPSFHPPASHLESTTLTPNPFEKSTSRGSSLGYVLYVVTPWKESPCGHLVYGLDPPVPSWPKPQNDF